MVVKWNIFEEYSIEMDTRENNKELLIIFSSAIKNRAFGSFDFRCNMIYISDKNLSYFTKGADVLISMIKCMIRHLGVNRVIFMGTSKGGYAALLYAAILGDIRGVLCHAIAFGPQTMLYPNNNNLDFPSYKRLIKLSKIDMILHNEMKLFGILPTPYPKSITAQIFYSIHNPSDVKEALRVNGKNIEHIGLKMKNHVCHLPFVVDTSNEKTVRLIIDRVYVQAKTAGDQSSEEMKEIYVQELLNMPKQENIVALVKESFATLSQRNKRNLCTKVVDYTQKIVALVKKKLLLMSRKNLFFEFNKKLRRLN